MFELFKKLNEWLKDAMKFIEESGVSINRAELRARLKEEADKIIEKWIEFKNDNLEKFLEDATKMIVHLVIDRLIPLDEE